MEQLTQNPSPKFNQLSLFPTNATFSQESEDGQSPSSLPGFQSQQMSGQAPARASHSRSQEKRGRQEIVVTSGLNFTGSSKSIDLQSSLESKLQARLPMRGGIQWPLTWKTLYTPALRQVSVLTPSSCRISANGYSGWPTPIKMDSRIGYPPGSKEFLRLKEKNRSLPLRHRALTVDLKHYGIYQGQRCSLNPEFVRWLMGYPVEWAEK